MGTIAEKLSYLNDTKTAIKNAIVNKGVAVADTDTFRSYADKVGEIVAKGDYNIEVTQLDDGTQQLDITDAVDKPIDMLQARVDETKSCDYLFYQYQGNNPDIVKRLDTTGVTSMQSMFSRCSKLKSLDISNFNTSNVTNMSYMFEKSNALQSLILPNSDTKNVHNMSYMFSELSSLKSLDLSNFDTSSVTSMNYMFYYCQSLTDIDLSSFNTSNVTDMSYMFQSNQKLTNILGTLDMIKVTNTRGMFSGCPALTDFTLKNIKVNLQIGGGTQSGMLLSDATIINTAKELWDLTGATSQTLTVSTTTSAKLDRIYVKLIDATDEMIANDPNITNKKPCEVCESTNEGAMTLREYIVSKNWSISG